MTMIVTMMITLHCPMSGALFTNIPIFSTLQNDIEYRVLCSEQDNTAFRTQKIVKLKITTHAHKKAVTLSIGSG